MKSGLLCAALAVALPVIESVEYWEKRFRDSWQSKYDTCFPACLEADSWRFYNLGSALSANAAMFEAAGNTGYLDRTLLYIANTISTAEPSSDLSDSRFDDDCPGRPNWIFDSRKLQLYYY